MTAPGRAPAIGGTARVGRQAIYDRERQVVAYEMLFRSGLTAVGADRDDDAATTMVMVAAFTDFGLAPLTGGRPAFVNLTRSFIVGGMPLPLEPGGVVLELLETIPVDPAVLAGADRLVAEGYLLALDDFTWSRAARPLLDLASYVKLDVLGVPTDDLARTVELCRRHDVQLVAERIEDAAVLQSCLDLGFDLFQGYHLGRPAALGTPTLAPTRMRCLELLAVLSRPEPRVDEVTDLVRVDPALSLRMLRAANSAAVGARREITSIRDAVMFVGLHRLRSWVLLMTLSDGGGLDSDQLSSLLVRPRLLELLSLELGHAPPAIAFTLGMISAVGELLEMAPEQLADSLPLDPALREALVERAGPLGDLYGAVLAYEQGDGPALARTRGAPGLADLEHLLTPAHLSAIGWSVETVERALGA